MAKRIHEEAKKGPHLSILLQYLEYLVKTQSTYYLMKRRYNIICQQEFSKALIQQNHEQYCMELLVKVVVGVMKKWSWHDYGANKCTLPCHPSQIQVMEIPPEFQVSEMDAETTQWPGD